MKSLSTLRKVDGWSAEGLGEILDALIVNAEISNSDRSARVGFATAVSKDVFKGFDYAALSRTICLSTVMQTQGSGIRLDAMFVDEGFGSQDHDSINDALENCKVSSAVTIWWASSLV